MTRKNALNYAISLIKKEDIDENVKKELIDALQLCISELPYSKWSKEAIFDACDQYCYEHKRKYLLMTDFKTSELPSHPTIENRFKMSALEFRDKYYPLPTDNTTRSRYSFQKIEAYKKEFINEFKRINAKSATDFNQRRDKNIPTTITMQKMCEVSSWNDLQKLLKIGKYEPKYIHVISNSSFHHYDYIVNT